MVERTKDRLGEQALGKGLVVASAAFLVVLEWLLRRDPAARCAG